MNKLILLIALMTFNQAFAQDLNCEYLNHDNTKGKVEIRIDNTKVVLNFASITISADKCKVDLTPTELTVECEELENAIGIIFELIDGKFQGVLMSEKAQVFAQAKC